MRRPAMPDSGRAWAYLGLVAGLGVSLAANVQAAYIDTPEPGWVALMMAGLPPGAVFIAIEVLARNQWPEGAPWRRTKRFGTYGVGVASAVVSYVHLVHLMVHGRRIDLGNLTLAAAVALLVALLTPLAIDGLLGLCTGALLINRHAEVLPEPGSEVATREVRLRTIHVPHFVDRVVEVEKEVIKEVIVYRDRPVENPPVSRETKPRGAEHPLWAEFAAAERSGAGWSNDRVHKELTKIDPNTTPAAARALANRWRIKSRPQVEG